MRIARHMGAARGVAAGRNLAVLQALGADAIISLVDDSAAQDAAFHDEFARGVDAVLDYLWGPSAERMQVIAAKAGPEARPIRFVQIGPASGAEIRLGGAILRSSSLEIMGSGVGSVPLPRLLAAIEHVFHTVAKAELVLPTNRVHVQSA